MRWRHISLLHCLHAECKLEGCVCVWGGGGGGMHNCTTPLLSCSLEGLCMSWCLGDIILMVCILMVGT